MNSYQQHLGVPRDQQKPERHTSPLRIKELGGLTGSNVRQTTGNKFRDEEDEYERRRQDELRKYMQRDSEVPYPQSSAIRTSYNTGDMYTSGKSYASGQAERDKPTSTHFTLGPAITNPQATQEPPHHIREHMANIQSDNQSLMRRLNLVIQELERVNKEKEDVYLRLKHSSKEVGELQNMINSEDNVDKVNKYMSDDLVYERDRNHKLKSKIKELDIYKNELIHELRKLQEQQDEIAKENQQLTYGLQQKLTMIQDIEKEHYFTSEKIKQSNNAVESLKLQMMDLSSDKSELQKILNQLILERNDLLSRLDHLTRKYDECVRDISHDRAEMERHNKQHAKLITAKIIFQQLEQIQKSRKAQGYQEFKQYCNFDQKCHAKLLSFAKVLERLGHYKLRKYLRGWYQNALDPIKMRQQSKNLAVRVSDSSLKLKIFIQWRNAYQKRIDQYDMKTKAIQQIWHLYHKDTSIELKRSFSIWKETMNSNKIKQSKVKKLVWRLYFNRLNVAFNTWTSYSSNLDSQVRLNLLGKEFSNKQYLTILFHKFRFQITESKRKRYNILFHSLKSWKDFLAHQKYLMGSNLVALHFRNNVDKSTVKGCFDALRIHKESEKLSKLNQILFEEELPQIEELQIQTDDIQTQRLFRDKSKACQTMKKLFAKQLYPYFQQWKQVNETYKDTLKTTVKDKIIKVYMDQIRKAFTYWKTLHDGNKIESQQMVISEFQQEQNELNNELLDLNKEIKNKQGQRDCSSQKQVMKCVTSFNRRLLEIAMGRWRDRVNDQVIKEDGSETILKRLRLRFLRQAFDLYLAGVKYKKKLIIEEQRCALYHRTRDERLKKHVMNAWLLFKARHQRAKKSWYRLHIRLDISLKQQAMKRWIEFRQKHEERQLRDQQNKAVEKIEDLNNQIGQINQNENQQSQQIQGLKSQLTKQAQRILSNAFARFYYTNETRGIEKWKEFVIFEKHKERMIRRTIDHWRKYQFYSVKSAFQNWMQNQDIQERKDQLKKEEMRSNDAQFQLEQQTNQFAVMKAKLDQEMEEIKKLQSVYSGRLQKSIQMIIRKVDSNDFMSQKRYILTQWRDYVKREVNFINCIKNVIQKSLWNKGFNQIRNFSREVRNDRNKEDVLNKFRLKFYQRTCANAFSIWRSGAFTMVQTTIEEVDSITQEVVQEYQNKKAVFKEVNKERSGKLIQKNNLRNLFQSWKNVTQFLKLQNSKDESFKEASNLFQKRIALHKWQSRKNATKMARIRMKKLKEKFYRIRLRQYFLALRNQFEITKDFCKRMSNLASIHDHQGLKLTFNAIQSFAKAKQFVHETKKANASRDIEQILTSLVLRKKQLYWNDFRLNSMVNKREQMLKAFTIMHTISNKMRFVFQKWKEAANERTLAKEMHQEGPIREEVFEIKAQLKNLRKFMEGEGYDEKDIIEALNKEKQRQAQLILKGLRRMQHYNEELYPKPKAFDRWRQFVNLKKLFRYWLGYAAKRGEYVKSDLHYAFDKWKSYYSDQQKNLQKLSKDQLEKRLLNNNKNLDALAEQTEDKENSLGHLQNQREALVENYIKGQKLALSMWLNYRRKTLHQAFLRWCKKIKTDKNDQTVDALRRNLELIENLKKRISEFEAENEGIANENEELRQFSLDGYEIAKNVQALTAERENLSVDLADKSQIIRKLLDENEKLTNSLRKAQDEAQHLIRSTMAGSSGFKSGIKTGYGPMTKSSLY